MNLTKYINTKLEILTERNMETSSYRKFSYSSINIAKKIPVRINKSIEFVLRIERELYTISSEVNTSL